MEYRSWSTLMCTGAIALATAAACSVKDPLFCRLPDHPCTGPYLTYCDESGTFPASEGIANTCIPSPFDAALPDAPVDGRPDAMLACVPSSKTCTNSTYVECDAAGHIATTFACGPLGCSPSGRACLDIDPSNHLAAQLDLSESAPVVVLTGRAQLNTDTGILTDASGATVVVPTASIAQGGGMPAIRVLRVKSLTIEGLLVRGSDSLAIVSDGDVAISGTLDISAYRKPLTFFPASGAGGWSSTDPCAGRVGTGHGGGGGGGGRYSLGGKGGDGGGAGAGAGGAVVVTPHGEPLAGGCPGGVAQGGGTAFGGGGGGALQITSRTQIVMSGKAAIDASGGGGEAGSDTIGVAGGGGGSGGLILLEAPTVDVTSTEAVLATRGGGGASSSGQDTEAYPVDGEDGDANPGSAQAQGGSCADGCAHGGVGEQVRWINGASWLDFLGNGGAGAVCGGGGGGASGALVIKTRDGTSTVGAVVRAIFELSEVSTRERTQ